MKAVVAEKFNTVAMWDIPEPEVGPYNAKVKTLAGSLCNSTDMKILHEEFAGPLPAILGHEAVGEITELGEKVTNYRVGDLVVRQRVGSYPDLGLESAFGSFVEYGLVTDEYARADDEGAMLSVTPNQTTADPKWDHLALVQTITLKETLSFLRNLGVQEGDSILVYGTGPVGVSFSLWGVYLGCSEVIVVGRRDEACARSLALGRATHVINNKKEHVADSVRKITGQGVTYSIEAIGENEVLLDCLDSLAPGGKVGIYGVPPDSQGVSPLLQDERVSDAVPNEASVDGEVLALVTEGKIPAREFVTHELTFEECGTAFELLESKQAFKTGLKFARGKEEK